MFCAHNCRLVASMIEVRGGHCFGISSVNWTTTTTITPLLNIDHSATASTGGSESHEPNTHTEEWLVQARLRLAALRRMANKEPFCSADDAEQVALSAGQDIPIREPVRVPLSDQLSTGRNSEQIAEMVLENRNLTSVSLGGRVFKALIDSGAMVSLVGAEIARICRERIVPSLGGPYA